MKSKATMIIFGKGYREKSKKCVYRQLKESVEVLTCVFYLHSMLNTFVPLSEVPYSLMHLNCQFKIHPEELENISRCLARERTTPTTHSIGLQEVLAPERNFLFHILFNTVF